MEVLFTSFFRSPEQDRTAIRYFEDPTTSNHTKTPFTLTAITMSGSKMTQNDAARIQSAEVCSSVSAHVTTTCTDALITRPRAATTPASLLALSLRGIAMPTPLPVATRVAKAVAARRALPATTTTLARSRPKAGGFDR